MPVLTLALALLCISLANAQPNGQPSPLPPRIIACTPEPFATGVDPALKEISVTFDRPMSRQTRSGFGQLRYAGVFPAERGAALRWSDDGATCFLPAHLDKDVTYAVAVNSTKQRGFVDEKGKAAISFAWVFATGPRAPDDFPAHAISSDPAPGATEVDFRQRQIHVTFDRPLSPGDFSWVILRGSGEYPGSRAGGPPHISDDRRTVSLDVRLSPGTVYAIGVNDAYYFGYKDTKGRPVIPFGLCFKTQD